MDKFRTEKVHLKITARAKRVYIMYCVGVYNGVRLHPQVGLPINKCNRQQTMEQTNNQTTKQTANNKQTINQSRFLFCNNNTMKQIIKQL